ncbi:MAG: hypothetical protein ABSH16_00980 [Sedimentisphaerales bacterium]
MKSISKMITVSAVLACVMLAPVVIEATMTIKKTAEGKYEGTWSAQFGESTLSDITFDNGKLAFVQTSNFGGREMKTAYEGKVEGAKLNGTGKGQFGEVKIEGTLKGEPNTIAGEWQINTTMPTREMVDKLSITKDANGVLGGKWTGQRGESTVSNMKLEGNKLTFTRKSKMGEMEIEMTYEGTVEGDAIKGKFTSERGEREANATRVGAAKPEAGKAEPNKPATHKHEMMPEPNKPK